MMNAYTDNDVQYCPLCCENTRHKESLGILFCQQCGAALGEFRAKLPAP